MSSKIFSLQLGGFRLVSLSILLVLLNILVFIFELIIGPSFVQSYGFTPATFFSQPWTLITSLFLHGGFLHIFLNMWALFMFGPYVEAKIGSRNFFILYFVSGIIGNVFYGLTVSDPAIMAIGASGAVYGVLGAIAVLEPDLVIFMMFIPMPMYIAALLFVAIEFTFSISAVDSGIAHWAHLGGLFFGFVFGYFLKNSSPPEKKPSLFEYYKSQQEKSSGPASSQP